MIGQSFSHYRVTGKLGAGGMGEVWRARDTRLDREVAIKVLPAKVASDPERMARFEREAKLLASLNHPNIAAIYGFEESSGIHAIVMELVEGPTLAERIRQGSVPMDEALPIARQIADALESAHEHGIVHRDLKPANVKLRPDGTVKVLDFGLAKALAGEASISPDESHSPTLTRQGTAGGVILGTAAYMSPEQAKGRPVDKRADIWAFACVVYEMLTGRRPFDGETVTDVLAAVVRAEPDWTALPADTRPAIRLVLRRGLEKDPRRRLRDIGDARIEIDDTAWREGDLEAAASARQASASARTRLFVAALLVLAAAAGAAATWVLKPEPASPPVARVAVTLPSDHVLSGGSFRNQLALSPDGTNLVYWANQRLYLRPLGALEAVELPGTEAAAGPFFSPDGKWIGFFASGQVKKTQITGGAPITIGPSVGSDASWAPDDTIWIGGGFAGILRMSAAGGTPEVVVAPEPGLRFVRPQVLPDGRAFLYTRMRPGGLDAETVLRSLESDEGTVALRGGSHARYAPTGHLVYGRESALIAVAFDPRSREVTGGPVTLVENVDWTVGGTYQFSFSDTGTLAYAVAGPGSDTRLVAVDRSGNVSPLLVEARAYSDPRVSPDGRLVALHLQDEQNDVWVAEPARGALTRLSFEPGEDETPIWAPDGRSIAWAASRADVVRGVYRRAADGSGAEELLWRLERHAHLRDWSPDGRILVVEVQDPTSSTNIWRLDLDGKPTAAAFLQTPFNERNSRLSPDGRWLAYVSDESGRDEVYVLSFPEPAAKLQVSTSGADQPVWSRDGRRIFFRGGEAIYEVPFEAGSGPRVGAARSLFPDRFESPQAGGHTGYDVWPDGRFLMIESPKAQQSPGASRSEIVFVFNWFEELKGRVRADRR